MFYHSAIMLRMLIATDISYKNLNAFHYWIISILLRYEDHISEASERK
jgi:hypothetical protein